jgi:hypothetical protein
VISADHRVDFKSLRAAYDPETRITSTDDVGAVTFDIHPDGQIERTTQVAANVSGKSWSTASRRAAVSGRAAAPKTG